MKLSPLPKIVTQALINHALEEDLGRGGDITTASIIPEDAKAKVAIASRGGGVIAGVEIAEDVFKTIDKSLVVTKFKYDGDKVAKNDIIITVEGKASAILMAERTALNFMGRMSGIATLTAKMVAATGDKAKIAATRKTTPGFRIIEKYAVQLGGGLPHRFALDDAIMIKDNHIAIAGGVREALQRAKSNVGHTVKIEIEVDTLSQLEEVLEEGGADIIMLDNMSIEDMCKAVAMIAGQAIIEASGNVTLSSIPEIAATGVDVISSGAITHSAPNFDVGLDFIA